MTPWITPDRASFAVVSASIVLLPARSFTYYPGDLKAVWPEFSGCLFEVWPAPGAREGPQKCEGLRPPHF